MTRVKTALNFAFRKNAQTGQVTRSNAAFADIASVIILDDVVFPIANYRFYQAKDILRRGIAEGVGRELDHMVNQISVLMSPPDGSTAPKGEITNLAGSSPITAGQAGVHWQDRTTSYLLWKLHKNKPDNWWTLTGKLNKSLSRSSFYTTNFGPIKIEVTRNSERGRNSKGQFISIPKDTVIRRAENVTSLGLRGRPSVYYSVATVTVSVFGRITAEMLPGLATSDPKKLAPADRNGSRVIDLIRNDDVRHKLGGGPKGGYRHLLDPFLSYYLTRTVPVRVNRVIENTLQRTGGSSSSERLN